MSVQTGKPRIALSMGDPAGVGPEICLRALADDSVRDHCVPIVLGDAALLERVARTCGLPAPSWVLAEGVELRGIDTPVVYDLHALNAQDVVPGRVTADTGAAAYRYVERAIDLAVAGDVDAICTAPIHKKALHEAGIRFDGHTEILAARTNSARACMMLTSEKITCSLVTTHVGYGDVLKELSVERILDVIEQTAEAMLRIRGRAPRLVVCGLNPHAGESGMFGGSEEERIIQPAVDAARAKGLDVSGPLSPDTAFIAGRLQETDAYVCMYHDQGLIPLKMLAFDCAVNVTLGLPIIRTSVDHGTALDIAWQGKANPNSLFEALRLAAKLTRE